METITLSLPNISCGHAFQCPKCSHIETPTMVDARDIVSIGGSQGDYWSWKCDACGHGFKLNEVVTREWFVVDE